MKPMKQSKMPKIKIPPQDLASFGIDTLVVDPFWYDVYGIEVEEEEEELNKES